MKHKWLERAGDFVLGKGFYIVLFLCVATIGISGYYLIQSVAGTPQVEPVTGNPSVVLPDSSAGHAPPDEGAASGTGERPRLSEQAAPESETSQPSRETQAPVELAVEPAPEVYTWPASGEIIRDYALETLSYDATMQDWRTHSGLDIAAALGDNVLALRGGTVTEVYEDDMMGVTVVVDHGDGMVSRYSNLAQETVAQPGDQVDSGAILGKVGQTALAESAQPEHVHVSLTVDGSEVNPADYLPQR
ncbi:MAG: M23 family metallopeptidase [Clostridium sp.]|nr:M23 family metallopeptidase [Clostridium sp.]